MTGHQWRERGQGLVEYAHILALVALVVMLAGLCWGTARAQSEPAPQYVRDMAWRPDGQQLAVGGSFGILLYSKDLQHSTPLQHDPGNITSFDWSPDSSKLVIATADSSVKIWSLDSDSVVLDLGEHRGTVAWSRDGSKIASGGRDHAVHVWDAKTGKSLAILQEPDEVYAVAWSPDGSKIASGGGSETSHGFIRLWDAHTFAPLIDFEIPMFSSAVVGLAWSPDSTKLAGAGGVIHIWNAATGAVMTELLMSTTATAVAWSLDGRKIAGSSVAPELIIWNAATGEYLANLEGHQVAIVELDWRPDGRQLASIALDHTLRLWDPATSKQTAVAPLPGMGLGNLRITVDLCVDDPALVASLQAEIAAEDLTAFIKTLKVQPAGKVDPQCASLLLQTASMLIDAQGVK